MEYLYGSSRLGSWQDTNKVTAITLDPDTNHFIHTLGDKQYELTNHLGNVLVTVTDQKIATLIGGKVKFLPRVVSFSDYYPFGMQMQSRMGSVNDYRYGFQGQEKENGLYGNGNALAFDYRVEDSRLGRFLSVDQSFNEYPGFLLLMKKETLQASNGQMQHQILLMIFTRKHC